MIPAEFLAATRLNVAMHLAVIVTGALLIAFGVGVIAVYVVDGGAVGCGEVGR